MENIVPFESARVKFTDEELAQIEHFGRPLDGEPTSFDEEVERHLTELESRSTKRAQRK
jgi:hypothetical protein